jgi:hypothetical protein
MRLDTEERLPRLFFTETGLAMLRAMMADRRFADPEKFAHVRQELSIDPASEGTRPRNDDTTGRPRTHSNRSEIGRCMATRCTWH